MSPVRTDKTIRSPQIAFAGALAMLFQGGRNPFGMSVRLGDLLKELPVQAFAGDPKTVITGICTDSRRVAPGALFIALGGLRTDGNYFIEQAVDRGAAAIISEHPGRVPRRAAYVQVESTRGILATVARRFHGHPERDLEIIGVTGTNGKTTVTTLLKHFLDRPDEPVGLLGTVAYILGRRTLPAHRTTPEPQELYELLAQMREVGCRRALMEVSSHGIEQGRVTDLPFRIAAFLNLTQDHIDYHGTMEDYFAAKMRLFTGSVGPLPEIAIINADDAYGRRLVSLLPGKVRPVTFGLSKGADFRAEDIVLESRGSRFRIVTSNDSVTIHSPLLGRYNVSNVLASAAIATELGMALDDVAERLASFPGVPGRMESIELGQDFRVLVDYAHTDDALRNALGMLRPITEGRLLVVFGCGGNRDRAKRALMTRAVLESADFAWATSDNPRREPIEQIFGDMRSAVSTPEMIEFVEDRRRAIYLAISNARPGDTVLIAGKGHETYQEFADAVIPFDDRSVARELLSRRTEPYVADA